MYQTQGDIITEAQSTEVNMPPRSYIEAIDRPTVLYILYSTIGAQQTNLLPENTSENDAIFPKSRYGIYQTTSQCLISYGCAIIVLYIVHSRAILEQTRSSKTG